MKKLKLIVSDFHIGRGVRNPNGQYNILEDFHHDKKFREFLKHYGSPQFKDQQIELIFNGDMFNLIQTDYHGHFPVIITESVSVEKMRSVIEGHPVFFKALKEFLSQRSRSLTVIVGNHDQELLWPQVRELFEKTIGNSVEKTDGNTDESHAVQWKNIYYSFDGIHIEHGHQYEAVNRIDPSHLFLTEGLPEPILNLPWGTLFAIQFLVKVKHRRPAVDKVRPFKALLWWCLIHDPINSIAILMRLVVYFISTRFSKNRYRQSSLKTTLKILKEASIFPDLSDAARQILRSPQIHTVIFGHSHVYRVLPISEGKQYINTGTWTDIISMDIDSFARQNRLTYVRIDYEDDKAIPLLRHWIGVIPVEDDAIAA